MAGRKRRANIPFGAPGLPARDSVQRRESFTSPQGVGHTILKTDERDAYDEVPSLERRRKKPLRKKGMRLAAAGLMLVSQGWTARALEGQGARPATAHRRVVDAYCDGVVCPSWAQQN